MLVQIRMKEREQESITQMNELARINQMIEKQMNEISEYYSYTFTQ